MKKKFFVVIIIFIVLGLALSFGITYLNRVFLPIKIKSLIIKSVEDATGKKAKIESVKLNLFKGLVLKGLSVSDEAGTILSLKEASCSFLIWPFFKKQIIIPAIKIKSPEIFLERRADNSWNLLSLLPNKPQEKTKNQFNIFISKIIINDGRINFTDDTLTPAFKKEITKVNLILSLSLPAEVKYNFKFEVPSQTPMKFNLQGVYSILKQELTARISGKDMAPKDFSAYCRNLGFSIYDGEVDALVELSLKDKIINFSANGQAKELTFSRDRLDVSLTSDLSAKGTYILSDEIINFSGSMDITNLGVSGIDYIDKIDGVKGKVVFNDAGLSAENLTANVLGLPINVKFKLDNFKQPLIDLGVVSSFNLKEGLSLLAQKFKFDLPVDLDGAGKLSVTLRSKLPVLGEPSINGSLEIANAGLKLKTLNTNLEEINGKFLFNLNQAQWSGVSFRYLDQLYKTSGVLTNFTSPGVQLTLSSKDLFLKSIFAVNDKLINLSELKGKYFGSDFAFAGNIDFNDPAAIRTDISSKLDIDLNDLNKFSKKFEEQLKNVNPAGIIHAEANFKGNINEIKNCVITARLSSEALSFYGLKAKDFLTDYSQDRGLGEISLLHLSLYDGSINANAKFNFASENFPYLVSASMEGVKIEKLKLDTPMKNKDIAGIVKGQVKINGFSTDLNRLSGAGRVLINEGKLWELNLFKGLGVLLFSRDFNSIIFSEAACDFIIQDKSVFTENLILKSNLSNIKGMVKLGFDSSIEATLDVEVSEGAPATGTLKDVTTAIISQAGKFGQIRVTGTLKEPKYKFKPAVVDIIKSLKDALQGSIFGK